MNQADKNTSWYADSANLNLAFPQLEGEINCDVCVIGAGLTGCSTALHLAHQGYDVVVLEARHVGWGASGRSGGQLISGFAIEPDDLLHLVGKEDAQRLWQMSLDAMDLVKRQIAEYEIDCELKSGHMLAAIKPRHRDELQQFQQLLAEDFDYDVMEFLDTDAMHKVIASNRYIAGLYDPNAGHIHPLNYTLGLAQAAQKQGVKFYEHTPVSCVNGTSIQTVSCAKGQIKAQHVAYCCNAYIDELESDLRSKIMPVGTYIAATEPLGELRAADLIRNDCAVADVQFVLDYFRLSGDRRLLFGGRVSYSTLPPPNLEQCMRQRILNVFPQLEDVGIDYTWGGFVAITRNRAPSIGCLAKNRYYAQGFSGHGIALTSLAGQLLAEVIAGTAERFDVFARIPHRRFAGGKFLRTPVLMLGTTYYRIRDML